MPLRPQLVEQPDLGFRVWSMTGLRATMAQAHRHSDIEANYIESGTFEYLFNGQRHRLVPRRLTFFWGAIPHQVIAAKDTTRIYWITLPLEWFLQWRLPQATTQAVLRGALVAEREESPITPLLLERWASEFPTRPGQRESPVDAPQREVTALEVQACIRRIASEPADPPRKRRPRAASTTHAVTDKTIRHIVTMTRFLADHHHRFITTADIAREAGLHPNYAMNLFKWFCGMSLGTYLTRLRISHAQRLLATTDKSVTDVAMASGFGSLSRFYEAFAAQTDQSPARYRRAMTR